MSQELKDIDWNEYAGPSNYGAFNEPNEKKDDFDNIKISLGQKSASYDAGKKEKDDLEEAKNVRKSNVSTGDDSGVNNRSQEVLNEEQLAQRANRCWNCIHVDYYQKYFNVTTQDVMQRLVFSFIPYGDKLAQAVGDNPDMYGPFWMYTSLIFLLALAENLHNYIVEGNEDFQYDFKNVSSSFFTVYGIGFGAPLLLSFLMKWISDTELRFLEVTCIYGYSFSSIWVCILLCVVPVDAFQWLAIIAALVVNLAVLFFNMKKELDQYAPKTKWLVVLGIWLVQIVVMMIFKLKFLHEVRKE